MNLSSVWTILAKFGSAFLQKNIKKYKTYRRRTQSDDSSSNEKQHNYFHSDLQRRAEIVSSENKQVTR
jgi:hypothetical protein